MSEQKWHQIQQRQIEVKGLHLHIAESGTGPKVVIFLHGFPETWYSWRHQIVALANAGFRAIAPDFRGYGLSDHPPNPSSVTFMDLCSDLLGIVDQLGISRVFLVAKDFGVRPAYLFALLHPDRIMGLVTLGVPYIPPGPSTFHKHLPEGFYVSRFGYEPGRAEADFSRFDAKTVIRNIYILFSRSEIPIAEANQEIMDMVDPGTPLPPWFSEEDLAMYASLYEKSGFQSALQVPYRSLNEKYDIPDPVLKTPMLVIIGGKDYSLKFPRMQEYIDSEKAKQYAPNLRMTFLPEGSHFGQEQFPEVVNKFILDFLAAHHE